MKKLIFYFNIWGIYVLGWLLGHSWINQQHLNGMENDKDSPISNYYTCNNISTKGMIRDTKAKGMHPYLILVNENNN